MNIQIETKRLFLKNHCDIDLENIHKLKSEPLVWRILSKVSSTDIE
jgi:hypothetical protein